VAEWSGRNSLLTRHREIGAGGRPCDQHVWVLSDPGATRRRDGSSILVVGERTHSSWRAVGAFPDAAYDSASVRVGQPPFPLHEPAVPTAGDELVHVWSRSGSPRVVRPSRCAAHGAYLPTRRPRPASKRRLLRGKVDAAADATARWRRHPAGHVRVPEMPVRCLNASGSRAELE
jgi:hypothetical protein